MADIRADLTSADIRRICGDILDWKLAAILALRPTAAEVEAAAGWAGGQDDLGQAGHPLSGTTAQIYDILAADDPSEEQGQPAAGPP